MSTISPDAKIELVSRYLHREVKQVKGPLYIKARFIADDLDLSSQEVGTALTRLADREGELTVEQWGRSGGGVTWCVSGS